MLYAYRYYILALIILVIAGIAGSTYYSYVNSFQTLTVTYAKEEAPIKLFVSDDETEKELQTVPSGQEIKIKKGSYSLKANSKNIAPFKRSINLAENPVTLSVTYQFSEPYLATLLPGQQKAITNVITTAYPDITKLYSASRRTLYNRGDFYGAVLTYKGKDSDNRDTLRVLLQKKNGKWTLLTKPPQLLLNKYDYPDAPKNALEDINKASPLPGAPNSPAIDPDSPSVFE